MAARDPVIRQLSARLGGVRKNNPDDDAVDLKTQLKAAKAEAYARELVDSWPPLSAEQRMRLAALLLTAEPVVA